MMRKAIAKIGKGSVLLGATLALAACATSKERVTLLTPAQEGKALGGVVVEYDNGGEAYLGEVNQQARLRGVKVPRFKQLDQVDPLHTDLMGDLPLMVVREYFYFGFKKDDLDPAELGKLQTWLSRNIENRPGIHVEIAAYTDAMGSVQVNDGVSLKRAEAVRSQVQKLIDDGQLNAKKTDIDVVAGSSHWARSQMEPGETATPNRDYRVAVVTIR